MEKIYDVIVDTDIGGDIDDSWAILTLLSLPNINIRLISVTNGNVPYKASLIAKTLRDAGREDIPIALGKSFGCDERPLEAYIGDLSIENYAGKVYADYCSAYATVSDEVKGEIFLLCMAPFTSLAQIVDLIEARRNLNVIAMAGSVNIGYFGAEGASPECNIATDVAAARKILAADLNLTLLPLDVCGQLVIDGEHYRRLLTSDCKWANLCLKQYSIWQEHYHGGAKKYDLRTSTSILYDMICVWRLIFPQYFKTTELSLTVCDDGRLTTGNGRKTVCALELVDQEKMKQFTVDALCGSSELEWDLGYHYFLSYASPKLNTDLAVYECGWENCSPIHKYGPVKRHYYILHFVESGSGYFRCNGKTYKISQNQGFLIKPGETAEYGAEQSDPWKYYWVGFYGFEAKVLMDKCCFTEGENVITFRYPERILTCMRHISENHGRSEAKEYAMLGYLYLLISYIVEGSRDDGLRSEDADFVKATVKYMNENYMRDIRIDEIAMAVGFERSYFYKRFTRQMNMSPKEYLTGLRLNKSLELIRAGEYSLEQISRLVGYKDYIGFARIFKKHFCVSPKEYRINPFEERSDETNWSESKQ